VSRGKVVVAGAGIGGLAASIALSRRGWDVTVVERDDTPMPDDIEGAFRWDRRGAPQVRHSHGFPALIRILLRDRYPDVLAALREAGVTEVSIVPPALTPDMPDYERHAEDLQVLSCRRTTLEWVLRRCALGEQGVELRVGVAVTGLLAGDGTRPLDVRGVRLDDGAEIAADVVVASTGRRDGVPAWFAAHGVEVPEDEHPTGTIYLTRFYRSRGDDVPTGFQGGRRSGIGVVVAGADNGTYSATLAISASDAELRAHLLDADRFEAVLPLFREMEGVVRCAGTPLTPVQVMGGLVNRIRRYTDARGEPVAHRFFAIGDAHTCTNPLYGRGASLAVLQALLVADALEDHRDDPHAAALAYESASKDRVEPWYDISLLTDLAATAAPSDRPRDEAPARSASPRFDLGALRRVIASGDPELSVLVVRTMSLLATPQELFGNPDVLARIGELAERPRDPSRPRRPKITRDDLLAAGR
jgi:2-polyprenyl-6-methoxyphenol hydroxylase-like FAD-dependent oxidoreductase